MEVRTDILNKLKCVECEEYLSCSPVLLKPDGSTVCGRCTVPKGTGIRNTSYEEVAQVLAFPCKFEKYGCPIRPSFLLLKHHEEECAYKQMQCPVIPSGSCNWVGSHSKLLDHWTSRHADKVLEHPCVLKNEVSVTEEKNFLTSAFGLLFLIYTKICLTTGKMYHYVQLVQNVKCPIFYYDFEIVNSNIKVVKSVKLSQISNVTFNDDHEMETNIKSLKDILGGFKAVTFKISLYTKIRCAKCNGYVAELSYSVNNKWFCSDCSPSKKLCKYPCFYIDFERKLSKHTRFYCRYAEHCVICDLNLTGSLEEHFSKVHSDITHKSNILRCIELKSYEQYCIAIGEIGPLPYWYKLYDGEFQFGINTPLHSKQLCMYKLVLELTNPDTGYSINKNLEYSFEFINDFYVCLQEDEYLHLLHNEKVNIKFEILRRNSEINAV